jgi:hypothetical protein
MSLTLYQLKNEYLELSSMLEDETIELPAEAIHNTLEGIQGELQDKVLNVAAIVETFNSYAEAIKKARERMQKRERALTNRAEQLKAYIVFCMSATGLKKAESPEIRVSLCGGRGRLVIDNEEAIPEQFLQERIEKVVLKTEIIDAMNSGQEVPGVHIEKTEHIRIS